MVLPAVGQSASLDSLISSFQLPKGWNVNFDHSGTKISSSKNYYLGKLTFINSTRRVVYKVYTSAVLNDSVFIKEENDRWLYSSCTNFFGSEPYYIGAFTIDGFYFASELCPKCDFANDKKCTHLAKYLHTLFINYHLEQIPNLKFTLPNIKTSD